MLGIDKSSKEEYDVEGRDIPVNVPSVLLLAFKTSIKDICAAAEAARADARITLERYILLVRQESDFDFRERKKKPESTGKRSSKERSEARH